MPSSPRTVAVGVDLGSATTTVSTRRDGGAAEDVHQSPTTANGEEPQPIPADEPALIGLAVPATWSTTRRRAHAEAAANAGFDAAFLVSEPEAAARHYAAVQGRRLEAGAPLVVCNLGAASCHAAVVRREGERYQIEAAKTADDIGGRAFDQLLLDHLAERLRRTDPDYLARVQNPGETALRAAVLDEVRRARERLSDHPSATVGLPGLDRELRLTREDADQCLTPAALRTVSLIEEAMRDAGIEADQIAALLLVGGASRTPLLADVIGHHFGVAPVLPDLPDLVIAEGAALAGLARIGDGDEEESAAAAPFIRMRTSPEVIVTMMVVVLAVLSFAGVALLNREGPDVQDVDAATETPLPETGGEESVEPTAAGAQPESDQIEEPEPTAPVEEDAPASPTPETSATPSPEPTNRSATPAGENGVAVPDVLGESLEAARAILAEAGFTAVTATGEQREGNGQDAKNCEVTDQTPGGGAAHFADEPIALTYAYTGNDSC
ncbi:PASTA domain-containing protein [Glycomyces sambucus]|uniref:PASTA domain-containing protein n=1 Tax=Glycomyces sambucus TaxID=380244 RepID=A0A1G9I0U1_9ACTN|nr:Hsp70 family protein [Glycomyces sambucus]SDL18666.1 PASTA domain-containing protein [Glycomyces sambucus]